MQPTFNPWIGYFDLINGVDKFLFLDTVQLNQQSWQTRNKLKVANKELMISIPIKKNISTLLKGNKVAASDKKVKMREKTCLHCDWFEKKKLRCIKCGCIVPIKIRLEEESCPLNKW